MSAHHSNKWLRDRVRELETEAKEAARLLGLMTDLAQYHVDQIEELAGEKGLSAEESAERTQRAAKTNRDYAKAEAFLAARKQIARAA